jgi:hypothetical protein
MTGEQEHCKSEGRCMDFAFAPIEWRAGDICHIFGCDGDTRSKGKLDDRNKVLEYAWRRIEQVAPMYGIHTGWVLLSEVKAALNSLRKQGTP